MSIEEFIQKDNTFSESGFIAKVDNTFIMLLNSIMTDNLERVKHKISSNLFDYFVGQVMKQTRGKANPVLTKQILKEELKK